MSQLEINMHDQADSPKKLRIQVWRSCHVLISPPFCMSLTAMATAKLQTKSSASEKKDICQRREPFARNFATKAEPASLIV